MVFARGAIRSRSCRLFLLTTPLNSGVVRSSLDFRLPFRWGFGPVVAPMVPDNTP